ncbi:hypothetical protein N7G274_001112 [Stereocaulon virgatum]|uniref:Uncharacterized protein n=1 Tax=Stereocaulon virgatum TaxID=373712 RepID=A0ABR4AUE9_9LECA
MALYWARVRGHEKAAEELSLQGADVSFTDEKGQILLHWAVESASTQMVTWPLDKGAVIPARDSGGGTALHVAAEICDQEMMKLLNTLAIPRHDHETFFPLPLLASQVSSGCFKGEPG